MKCCPGCRGAVPFYLCRTASCWCHIEQQALDQQARGRDAHADPTARQAIANITRNNERRKRP